MSGVGCIRRWSTHTSLFPVFLLTLAANDSLGMSSLVRQIFSLTCILRIYDCPVVTFAWIIELSSHFHKASVQTQVMAHRVLPACCSYKSSLSQLMNNRTVLLLTLFVLFEIRKGSTDEIVDLIQCHFLIFAAFDRHCDQRVVRETGLCMKV